jgi:hypothetical protein
MNLRPLLSLAMLSLLIGCTETRRYTLAVRNSLNTPVSICLTKMYGPEESGWESPEQMAAPPHPASDQATPGTHIPPGKTAKLPEITGQFDRNRGRAILRIYAGDLTLSQMNAVSSGSVNRIDVPLDRGENRVEIKEAEDGGMTAVKVTGAWPATQPARP